MRSKPEHEELTYLDVTESLEEGKVVSQITPGADIEQLPKQIEKKRTRNKNIISLSLLALVTTVLGLTFVVATQLTALTQLLQQQKLAQLIPFVTKPSPQPRIVEPSPTPTSSWQLYQNQEAGFQFEYPSDITTQIEENEIVIGVECLVCITFRKGSLEDNPDLETEQIEASQYQKMPFKGLDSMQAILKNDVADQRVILLENNGYAIRIVYPDEIYSSKRKEQLARILSTFEFISKKIVTRDWNTLKEYSNPRIGFSISFPNNDEEIAPYEHIEVERVSFCREGTGLCVGHVTKFINNNVKSLHEDDIASTALVSATELEQYIVGTLQFMKSEITYPDTRMAYYYLQSDNDVYVIELALFLENHKEILETFMLETPSLFCGGIAAIQCPQGFTCELDGDYPDAGGVCIETNRN